MNLNLLFSGVYAQRCDFFIEPFCMINYLRSFQNAFQNGCTIFYSHLQGVSEPVPCTPMCALTAFYLTCVSSGQPRVG